MNIVNHHGSIEEELAKLRLKPPSNARRLRFAGSVVLPPLRGATSSAAGRNTCFKRHDAGLEDVEQLRTSRLARDDRAGLGADGSVAGRAEADLATRVYPKPRDVFVTMLRQATKDTIGARATQVASDHGHVVVRVEPGGDRYWVIVLEEGGANNVGLVKGPYRAE